MSTRLANAVWEGTLKDGAGKMRLGSGTYEGSYTYASRFEDAEGSNPEELIGAALAGCFSMALSGDLTSAGYTPTRIQTEARVHLERVEGKATITRIDLTTRGQVPGIDEEAFKELAQGAKSGCPVSRALAVQEINLDASLE